VRIIGRLGVVIFGAAEWSLAELNTQQLARGINNVSYTLHVSKYPRLTPLTWAFEDFYISVDQNNAGE